MEPALILGAVAAFGIALLVTLRRLSIGQGRSMWVVYAPALVFYPVAFWAGIRLAMVDAVMGVTVVAVIATTTLLFVRMQRHGPSTAEAQVANGDVSRRAFDYLVWSTLGVPLILAGLLLVVAIGGRLSSR